MSETDPLDFDTDDDALNDRLEVVVMGGRNDCQALPPASWMSPPNSVGGLSAGVWVALHNDSDTDRLYDGFYDQYAVGLDVGAPAVGANVQIGLIPWLGFDGPDTILGNANDQPGEDVTDVTSANHLNGVWNGGAGQFEQETNACAADSDADGIWDGTEYISYESPEYNKTTPYNVVPWNTADALRDDTDIDRAPITMVLTGDNIRPALDVDSDGDMLCDGDIAKLGNIGCRGPNNALTDTNGDWIDDDSISAAHGLSLIHI